MLRISKKTDYGLLFLAYLARNYDKRLVSLTEAAQANRLPLPYLRQVALALHKARVIESREGSHGGYKLAMAPSMITMADIIQVFEGRVSPVACLEAVDRCSAEKVCSTKKVWQVLYKDMIEKFHTTTLEALV